MNEKLKTFESIASQRVCELFTIASQYFEKQLSLPTLSFRRSGANAGTAHLHKNKINLNPIYFLENQQEYVDQVIPHEVAHIVAHQVFGKVKPHGVEWQNIMRQVFDCQPLTRHKMETTHKVANTFDYLCGCGTTPLTIRRHMKVVRGEQQYLCRKCNQQLTPKTNSW